jgi:hypothetical protein
LQREKEEFTKFKEAMARTGNPISGDTPEEATATTTPGRQSLKTFRERWGILKDAERRGELTSGMSLLLQQQGLASDIENRRVQRLLALSQPPGVGYSGVPVSAVGDVIGRAYGLTSGRRLYGFGQSMAGTQSLLAGYGAALQPYQFQRGMEFSAAATNAKLAAQRKAGLWGGLGSLIGSGLKAYGTYAGLSAMASSVDFKKDINRLTAKDEKKILDMVKDTATHTYRYKGEASKGKKRLGLLAEEAPVQIRTEDGKHLDVGNYLGLLFASIKALDRKIDRKLLRGKKKNA